MTRPEKVKEHFECYYESYLEYNSTGAIIFYQNVQGDWDEGDYIDNKLIYYYGFWKNGEDIKFMNIIIK